MLGVLTRFIVLTVLTGMFITGCEKVSTDVLVQRAEQAIADNQVRAAMVDLMSVLREEPDNAKARWLLSGLYLSIEDGASAEKELRKASELGVGDDSVLPMLARSLQLQGKTKEVLAISPKSQLSPAGAAELEASRALAYAFEGHLADAEASINRALRLAPDSIFVRYVHAQTLVARDQVEAAIDELVVLTNLKPDFSPAWSLLGRLRGQRREYGDAERAYSNAISHRFVAIRDRIDRGFARLAQNKTVEAQEDVEVLLQMSPESHRVQLLAGLIYLQKREFDAAKGALDVAYSKSPNHLQGIIALATADTMLGNFNQGRSMAEKAFALAPDNVSARKLLARYALRDRDGAKAESLIRPVAQEFPNDLAAKQIWASSLILQDKVVEAAPLAQEVADGLEESAEAQIWAGIALMAAQKQEQGIQALSKAAQLAPEGRVVNNLLVLGLMESESDGEALAAAKRYVETNPDDVEAHNLLALTYLTKGDNVQARATLQRVLSMNAGNTVAARTLASLALRSGDMAYARSVVDGALDVNPDDLQLLILRADIARRNQDAETMERYLRQAIETNPDALRPRILLARALLSANNSLAAFNALDGVSLVGEPVALTLRAEAASHLGRNHEAKEALELLAEIAPNDVSVQLRLVKVYGALGNQYRMERAIGRLATLAPHDARVMLARAKILARQKKIEEAESLIETSGLDSKDPRVLSARLAVEIAAGRMQEAIHYARQQLQVQKTAENTVQLSRILTAAGNQSESVDVLRDWLATHPHDVPVMVELANVHERQGNIQSYTDQLLQILEVEPQNIFALNNLAWNMRVQSPLEALNYAQVASKLAPSSAAVMDTLAMVYAQNGDFQHALRYIAKAIDADSEAVVYRLHQAKIKHWSGDRDGALVETKELLRERLPGEIKSEAEALMIRLEDQAESSTR